MKTLPITMKGDVAEILIYGEISRDKFAGDEISAKELREQIQAIKAKTLNLRIDSPGGSVYEGTAMYAALRDFPGRIEVDIDGIAASMASFLAMTGDEIRINEYGYLMVHNPSAMISGGSKKMRETADLLDNTRNSLIEAYSKQSKADRGKVAAWMDAETWFIGKEAVDAGLAHSVSAGRRMAACADLKEVAAKLGYQHVPDAIIHPPRDEKAWKATEERRSIAAKLCPPS